MFDTLITKVRSIMAETEWQLVHCTDVYRLAEILKNHNKRMASCESDAVEMREEIEDVGNAHR